MREAAAEPAVEPLSTLARGDFDDLHPAHSGTTMRAAHMPATMAPSTSTTEAMT